MLIGAPGMVRRLIPLALMGACLLWAAAPEASALGRHPSADGDWAQLHYDATHAGLNPFETVLSPSTVPGLQLEWASPVGSKAVSPSVVGGVVYAVTDAGTLVAVDAATGQVTWQRTVGPHGYSQAVEGGVVYASSHTSAKAFDAATGALLWSKSLGNLGAEITVTGGVVYSGLGSSIVAVDAATGVPLWNRHFNLIGGGFFSAPTVVGNVLYEASYHGRYIYALDASSGQTIWSHAVKTVAFNGSPVVVNGTMYLGSDQGVTVFDAATGQFLWKSTDSSTSPDSSTPAVASGMVYYEDGQLQVHAFDANGIQNCSGVPKTCEPLWTFTGGSNDLFQTGSPAAANGVVYVCGKEHLYALDAGTGTKLWVSTDWCGSQSGESSPVVSNGVVYVGQLSGDLNAYALP
jgi:outer membrane protein assembly factor BamB